MRKKIKRIVPFILVGVLVSSFVMTNYNKAREVKAVVGVDDLAIAGLVTTLLLAYGYATTQYYNNTDGANALADEWEEEYNQARLTVINGGGGSDNGDDDDDKNKFEDTDGDGKITEKDIPPFSNFLTKNAVTLSANASLLLAPIVTKSVLDIKQLGANFADKFVDNGVNVDLNYIDSTTRLFAHVSNKYLSSLGFDTYMQNSAYPCCAIKTDKNECGYYIMYFNASTSYKPNGYYTFRNGKLKDENSGFPLYGKDVSKDYFTFNGIEYSFYVLNPYRFDKIYLHCPVFNDVDMAFNYLKKCIENNGKDIDWVTPELQDSFDNKGNLELLPSFDPLASYSMASQQALQELLSNLASSSLAPLQQLDLVNKFIAGLKTPEPSPNPDPSPEPNPNPDPSNPDNGDGDNSGESDVDKGSFVRDLRTLFPFCIPFDLMDCIRLFNAEPVTPKIEIPMHFAFVDVDYTWTIDLKDFNGVATVCRSMFLILFIVGLVLITRNLIRG